MHNFRVKISNLIVYIMVGIFIFRPLIDLGWQKELFCGLNLAGVVAIFLIVVMCCYYFTRKSITLNRLYLFGIIYVAYSWTIVLLNFTSYKDFDYVLRLTSELPFLIIVSSKIDNHEKFDKILIGFLIASIIPIIITFLQVAGIVPYTYFDYVNGIKISRGSGGYRQPSVLTRFCSMGLIYAMYFWDKPNISTIKKIGLLLYIGINIVSVVFSYHRTGYFLVCVIIGLWLYLKYKNRTSVLLQKVIIIGLVIIILFFMVYEKGLVTVDLSTIKKMLSFSNILTVGNDGKIYLLRGRGKMLEILWQGMIQNKWYYTVFGNGVNVNSISKISLATADMELVRVLWNCGLVGGAIWIIQYIEMWRTIKNRKCNDRLYRLGVCIFVSFLIWGLTIEATNSPDLIYHIFFVGGYVGFQNQKLCCTENES